MKSYLVMKHYSHILKHNEFITSVSSFITLWRYKYPDSVTVTVSTGFSTCVRAHLHQGSVSTLQQLHNDASNSVLIGNNSVTWKWVATPFWSNSIVDWITSVIGELLQCWCWCWHFVSMDKYDFKWHYEMQRWWIL